MILRATAAARRAAANRAAITDAAFRIRGDTATSKTARLTALAAQHGVKKSAVYNWMARVADEPRENWPKRLLAADATQPRGVRTTIPATEWNEFKRLYLRLEQPTLAACYRVVRASARRRGVRIPTQQTFANRLRAEVPAPVRTLSRGGRLAAQAQLPPQRRDVSALRAMEAINGDGYKHNVFVVSPEGEIYRPVTWMWQDIRSRRIMAWRTAISENTDTLRLSFLDLCREWGIPQHIVIDNTRAAANKWLSGGAPGRKRFKNADDEVQGVWQQLGIRVHWTSITRAENGRARGHGQAKPIERAFRDFDDFDRQFDGAYAGRNTTEKPANYGNAAVPEAAFNAALKTFIAVFNAREGRRSHVANGASYDAVFAANYESEKNIKLTGESEMLLLLAAECRKVRPDGTLTLSAGSAPNCPQNIYGGDWLYAHVGERLIARYDPQHLDRPLRIFSRSGRFLGDAECIHAVGFFDTRAARELQRYRRRQMAAWKHQAEALRGEQNVMRQRPSALRRPVAPAYPVPPAHVVPAMPPPEPSIANDLINYRRESYVDNT